MSDVTRILNAIEGGDAKATDELLPLVYEELPLLAAQKLSHEKSGQTLQAMTLVKKIARKDFRPVQAEFESNSGMAVQNLEERGQDQEKASRFMGCCTPGCSLAYLYGRNG